MIFSDFNYILFSGRHLSSVTDEQIGRVIPQAEGGLGWDVRVPRNDALYDGRTIKRMAKLVNRRGRMRWIGTSLSHLNDDTVYWLFERQEKIKGVDDLADFIGDHMRDDLVLGLYVSFEDRFEARRFKRDLEVLMAAQRS